MSAKKAKDLDYTILTLTGKHVESTIRLLTESFCDSEPLIHHLHISYRDYEPFAREVIEKAAKEKMSVIAVDKKNHVIACTIAEDIINPFVPNLSRYPKLKPMFDLLGKLDEPFLKGKKFIPGKIAHIWIAIVDPEYRGKGLSTEIDMACADLVVNKGYEFAYAEFTNAISEKITHHYSVYKLCNNIKYNEFRSANDQPFKGMIGGATSYLIGIKPDVKLNSIAGCYRE